MGPELQAARANLGGTTKKSNSVAALDLNSLGSRQAVAGNAVPNALALPSGAGVPLQPSAAGGDSLQSLQGDATGATSTTAGPATRVVPVGALQQGGTSMSVPAPHAETVIRGQINPAAKSCYQNDPDSKSKQPGRLIILIKLTPAGETDSVIVASNSGLSSSVTSCITTAARAAKFAPPGAKGATVRAAFAFPGQEEEAPLLAAPAKVAPAANASGRTTRDTFAGADAQAQR